MDVGGAERFTLNLCMHFAPRVKNVTVFSSGGIFVKELERLGIRHIEDPLAQSTRPVDLLKLRRKLKKLIIEEDFHIIHAQHRIFVSLLNSLRLTNKKIIYTANNYFNDYFQKVFFPDVAVAISPLIERNLKDTLLIKKERIFRVNYGVESRYDGFGSHKNKVITVGFIGRIISEKGIFKLLKAVKNLYEQNQDLNLIIRGNGRDIDEVFNFIKNNLLSEKIRLSKPENDLNALYKDIDILVLPSDMNEGLPLTILEASARGKIVLASRKGAIEDVIVDNETGFLLNSNTTDEITKRLSEIIKKFEKLSGIRKKAVEKILAEFSMKNMLEGYEEVYKSLTQKPY